MAIWVFAALKSFAIAQDQMSHLWRGAADIVVEPDVSGFAYNDFKRAPQLVRAGEQAMRQALPEVRKWIDAPAETQLVAKSVRALPRPPTASAD